MQRSTIHLSLNRDKTIMGVDSNILTFEICLMVTIFIFQLYYFLILLLVVLFILKWLIKRDVKIIEASKIYSSESDFWDPWPNLKTFNHRDKKNGKGFPQ